MKHALTRAFVILAALGVLCATGPAAFAEPNRTVVGVYPTGIPSGSADCANHAELVRLLTAELQKRTAAYQEAERKTPGAYSYLDLNTYRLAMLSTAKDLNEARYGQARCESNLDRNNVNKRCIDHALLLNEKVARLGLEQQVLEALTAIERIRWREYDRLRAETDRGLWTEAAGKVAVQQVVVDNLLADIVRTRLALTQFGRDNPECVAYTFEPASNFAAAAPAASTDVG